MVYHEKCYCPEPDVQQWYKSMGCAPSYHQIKRDLSLFKDLNLEEIANQTISRYNRRGMHSLCQYRIIDNKVISNSLHARLFFMHFLSFADFFSKLTFSKKFFQVHYHCQKVWIQTRTNIFSVPIWVQTVCKGYQQTTKVATSKERIVQSCFSQKLFSTKMCSFSYFSMWYSLEVYH